MESDTVESEAIPEVVYCCSKCRGIVFNDRAFQEHKAHCTGSVDQSACSYYVCDKNGLGADSGVPKETAEPSTNPTIVVVKDGDAVDSQQPEAFGEPMSYTEVLPVSEGEPDVNEAKNVTVQDAEHGDSCREVGEVSATDNEGADVSGSESEYTQQTEAVGEKEILVVIKKEPAAKRKRSSDNDGTESAEEEVPAREEESVSAGEQRGPGDEKTSQHGGTQTGEQSDEVLDTTTVGRHKGRRGRDGVLVAAYKAYKARESCRIGGKVRQLSVYKCEGCLFSTPQVELFHVHMTKKHQLDDYKRLTQDPMFRVNRPKIKQKEGSSLMVDASRRAYYRERNKLLEVQYEKYARLDESGKQAYGCPACAWVTSRGVGMLHRHLTTVHEWAGGGEGVEGQETTWRCDECDFETNVRRKFVAHTQRHERRFVCAVCQRRFITRRNLQDHERLHTGEQPLKCDYEGCSYSTIQKRCLEEHKRKHTGERLTCDQCAFTTVYITALRNHINTKHREKTKYRCAVPDCTYVTNDKASSEKHAKMHANQKDFKCCHCSYRSVSKSQVVTHLQRVHNQEKMYGCDRCEFTTAYPLSLRYHIMAHLGLRPFSCPHCAYSSAQKVKIINHISSKHQGVKNIEVLDEGVKLSLDLPKYRIKGPRSVYVVRDYDTKLDSEGGFAPGAVDLSGFEGQIEVTALSTDGQENPEVMTQNPAVVCVDGATMVATGGVIGDASGISHAPLISTEQVLNGISASDVVTYQCSECEFTSSDYGTLSSHALLHRGIRLYQCPQCGFSSQQMDTVKEHVMEKHSQFTDQTINEISMTLESDLQSDPLNGESEFKPETCVDNIQDIVGST